MANLVGYHKLITLKRDGTEIESLTGFYSDGTLEPIKLAKDKRDWVPCFGIQIGGFVTQVYKGQVTVNMLVDGRVHMRKSARMLYEIFLNAYRGRTRPSYWLVGVNHHDTENHVVHAKPHQIRAYCEANGFDFHKPIEQEPARYQEMLGGVKRLDEVKRLSSIYDD